MKIAVSACLLGENCKYNGGNNLREDVLRFVEGHEVIPVCPEVLGGLPVPRTPAEIVDGTVTARDGRNVDTEFRRGAEAALDILRRNGVELCILQPRSPSCGAREIYDGTFSGRMVPGRGIFAEAVSAAGIRIMDAGELKN